MNAFPGVVGAWICSVLLGACGSTIRADDKSDSSDDLKHIWKLRSPQAFGDALDSGMGFSFGYDGKRVGPRNDAVRQMTGEMATSGGSMTWRHPSGLVIQRQARSFPEFDAVEFTLTFKNESTVELPALSEVNAVDLSFRGDVAQGVLVVSSGGGGADATFPPKDFALLRTPLGRAGATNQLTLFSDSGRPSKVNLPFLLVHNEAKAAGIFVGVGWTGNWAVHVRTDARDARLQIQGGMPNLHVRLRPGEVISSPRILIGNYRGDVADGANALRRLIRDRYAPSVNGERLVAPVLYTTWFDIGAELDEKLCRTLVERAAEIGMEVFLLDAGWYKGTPACSYSDMRNTWNAISSSLGNWEQGEERSRFPSGLKSLAQEVRSKGMQFGLWFEAERAGPESLLAKEHPDWLAFVPKRKWALVDFGKPEVQEYFCRILDRYIQELDLRYIRWDCNTEDFSAYWTLRDTPDRKGISEIRHLEGLHRVEDHVRQRHPGVIFESCAGGGHRIDLATLERRHTIWISDQTMDASLVRFHLEGLNSFIPGSGQGVAFAPRPNTYRQPGFVFPELAWQSCFGGAFGAAGRLHEWPATMREQARKHYAVFKQLRRFLSEDYYLLLPQARTPESWSAWQFHDAQAQAGFVQAFRLRSAEPARKLVLRGLEPTSRYEFTDPYTGKRFEASGAKLVLEGLEFSLSPMTSRVLLYTRKR